MTLQRVVKLVVVLCPSQDVVGRLPKTSPTQSTQENQLKPKEELIDENVSWYGYDDFLKEQAEKRKQHIAKNVSLKSYGNTFWQMKYNWEKIQTNYLFLDSAGNDYMGSPDYDETIFIEFD